MDSEAIILAINTIKEADKERYDNLVEASQRRHEDLLVLLEAKFKGMQIKFDSDINIMSAAMKAQSDELVAIRDVQKERAELVVTVKEKMQKYDRIVGVIHKIGKYWYVSAFVGLVLFVSLSFMYDISLLTKALTWLINKI